MWRYHELLPVADEKNITTLGEGLIGINKGIHELEEMGLSNGNGTRMVSVQASGCAPIVKAFEEGREESELWENSDTVAFLECFDYWGTA